ncbi:hypothetical protein QVD17_38738 [Tagetes erecta]|uniref:FRIGIDA-like protein n=1 Tax=Tagetes erecta TaxID=13708 RepID=A0AAD8JR38_TARER|nr:hypothetical protein QVD17_38738 [Tagetes erecta]
MDTGAPMLSTLEATPHPSNSPDVTNTLTGDIPPPRSVKTINELRSFSAALSAFISRYDELQSQISFVTSEIESKLSNHLVEVTANPKQSPLTRLLETDCDRTITVFPEAVVAERNPRESESEIEGVGVLKSCEDIDVFEKDVESDSLNKCEEIVTLNKTDESVCDQTITVVAEAIVSGQNTNRTAANSERVHENATTPKILEGKLVQKRKSSKRACFGHKNIPHQPKHVVKKPNVVDASNCPEEIDVFEKPVEIDIKKKATETETSKESVISILESLCQSMSYKKMKAHVAKHISEMTNLRNEIAKALKLAKDPAKLVLNSIGRFFVQGSKPSCKGYCFRREDQKVGRLASVLILECFVMISSDGGIEIAKQDQEYAAAQAVIWKNRMIKEGGLRQTEEVDARGLLLLVCGFRIQDHGFMIQDIVDLIKSSNVKGISAALCRSAFLIPKIPEVIFFMVKNDLEVDAVDLAYTFGLDGMCDPQNILTTYLHKKLEDIQNGSSIEMLESMKQQLLDLESVKQCLESHNVDPSMLLPEFQINEKIRNLEKEINEGKLIQKRKSLENPIHHESKRACFGHENLPHQQEDVLKKPEIVDASSNPEELDAFKKSVEIGGSKKCEETVPETSCDQTTTAVPEAIISEQNPNGAVADCEHMEENVRTPEILEECDVSMKPEEIETLKETEETVPENSCDQAITAVPEVIVSEQNPKGMATNCEAIVPETCDQTITTVPEAIVAEQNPNGMATDCEQIPENVRTPESVEETDVTMKPEEIDSMKKTEETVPEASCNQTMTTLPEAIVSEQIPNGMVADNEQFHENVRTPEIHEEIHLSKSEHTDYCKSPEKIDALHPEEIARPPKVLEEVDVSKKPEVISTSKKPRVISTSKKPGVIGKSKKPGAIGKSKKPGAISASKKPETISTSKKLLETDILNKPEQTDICKNFDEIDALKEHGETGIEKKATKTGTSKKPEVISTSNKLKQTDILNKSEQTNICKNTEVDTSKKHAETGIEKKATNTETSKKPKVISTSKKPKVISTFKKLKQADILNKPEQTDLCKNLEEVNSSQKHAEIGVEKKATKTETSKKPEVISTSKKSKVISTSKNLKQTDVLNKPEQTDFCKNTEKDTTKKHAETGIEKKATKTESSKKSVISELESLCRSMSSKEMKRHLATHISEMSNLRHEIAKALKLAKDPAKLVLDSIGGFYVQSSRSYCKGYGSQQEHQNAGKLASVLILECFVMIRSDGIEIEKRDREYAAAEAVIWRKRMIRDGGGLRHTDKVDARGLLLLISGFGIQDRVFTIKDITELIRASKAKEIATVLRRSVSLVSKIPEVVDWMMKNNLEIEAVDMAYAFGLEDKCHTKKMLSKFLDKKIKDIRNGNGSRIKLEAAKRQLTDLISVRQCLESHNIDPSMLLPDFEINKRIQNLEKEINEEILFRKRESLESPIHREPKRARLGHTNMPHQQKHVDHYDMRQLTPPSTRHLYLDRNHSNSYITNYLHPSVLNAPRGLAGGLRGSYDQMVHLDNVQPYGHYTRHVQAYAPETYCRPPELSPLESFPAFLDPPHGLPLRQATSLDLYRFADMVENEVRYS